MEPLTPQQLQETYGSKVPDVVIECVNELLARQLGSESQKRFVIYQKVLVSMLEEKGVKSLDIFNHKYLDFEPTFRRAGWKVTYDKAHYSENRDSEWVFEIPFK